MRLRAAGKDECEKGKVATPEAHAVSFLLLIPLPKTRHSGVKLLCK